MSRQTHIFATRTDLEPGIKRFESDNAVRYARCDLYYGPIFEQYLSLLDWKELGKNTTGDHVTGPRFLIVRRTSEINVETVPQVAQLPSSGTLFTVRAHVVDASGYISRTPVVIDDYISEVESDAAERRESRPRNLRYNVSQKLNPDSIIFSPGGQFKDQSILICGHIGTVSNSPNSLYLYKRFVQTVTKGFEKICNYRVGPDAARRMAAGYRMVTIGISSPTAYDLHRR